MKKLLFAFALLGGFMVQGQSHQHGVEPCGTNQYYEDMMERFPDMEWRRDALIQNSFRSSASGDSTLVIPVVFHVMHEYGSENISKTRILNEVARMSEYFQKLNSDTTQIVPAFQGIIGNANIEFRLATKDPGGNCTDGINRIPTNESQFGDFASKINQWPADRYLNIWIAQVAGSGSSGPGLVLAYATFPGTFYAFDGIMCRADAVYGGTFDDGWTLNHEVGHYLGLLHTWGNGQVDTECGDDGISDTPSTAGSFSCDLTKDECNPGTVENVQNFMDYAACGLPQMFTTEQASYMREQLLTGRPLLSVPSNLAFTGTDGSPAPECSPMADFHAGRTFACVGDNVQFFDDSYRANNYTYNWSFPDATPSSSTDADPNVSFNSPGWKEVTLTVSNAAGQTTVTKQAVHISPNWAVFQPDHVESFENETGYYWRRENLLDNEQKFTIEGIAASDGGSSVRLNNWKNVDPSAQIPSDDFWYYRRLGGRVDRLVSPPYDMSLVQSGQLLFDYAYATNAAFPDDITEELRIWVSTNCGVSWSPRGTINEGDLVTAGGLGGQQFIPDAGDWVTGDINVGTVSGNDHVMFMFEFTSGDLSNNLYIDNIRFDAVVSVDENQVRATNLNVYPNPANERLFIELPAVNGDETLMIYNASGQLVYESTAEANVTKMEVEVADWARGIYHIQWVSPAGTLQSKFVH